MNTADIAFPHLGIYLGSVGKSVSIFGFNLAFYGIIIALGMVGGIFLARWQAKRTGQDPDLYSNFALWGIVFALIGARLYYVIFSWDSYKDNLLQIFNIRGGGLAIYGGVIASVITAIVYCRIKKYNFLLFADTAMVGLIFGQIVGRWGNFTNREAFGQYTDSVFAMRLKTSQVNMSNITDEMLANSVKDGGETYIQVHPTFLYESLWNLMVLIVMILYTKKKKTDGEIFLIYFIGYGLGRIWIEGLRTDQLQIGSSGIAVSQVLSAALVVAGVVAWVVLRKRAKRQTVEAPSQKTEDSLDETNDISEE
ncbi:MAG: prolipoprotein diacylglyceryl transferase [Eubacterium sp.]|nr:prolipoprotein diacylglyceryl transferase [Eubacterium sp.]